MQSSEPTVSFAVNTEDLRHGKYSIELAVDEYYIFIYLEKVTTRVKFEITNHFNGLMELIQGPNGTIRENGYVSSEVETLHNIVITDKDRKLYDKAAYVRVFWFIDCLYVGMTDSLNFTNWYRNENGKYNVEALLMLSFVPMPSPTSTTTQKPTTTTTTSTTSTTTQKPTTTSTTTTTKKPARRRRDAKEFEWNARALVESGSIKPENIAYENMTEPSITTTTQIPMEKRIKMLEDNGVPYFGVCTNESKVVLDPKKIYGYYQRDIIVENPVKNISVGNNVWLRHGDMCRLVIKFTGTAPFYYCVKYTSDNTTEVSSIHQDCNEKDWKKIDFKEIKYERFLPKSSNSYSVIALIKNEVSFTTTTIGVQFYEEQPRSQLSVVIVPVVFSLMAVVLIVFGVAYYVQNRNQFLIEVADFNFGETQSVDSLEYKSFVQRLLDSISDLFIRHQYAEEPDSPGVSSRNYSVMP